MRSVRTSRARRGPVLALVVATLASLLVSRASAFRSQLIGAALPSSRPVASLLCKYADVATTYGFTPERVQQMWVGDPNNSIDAVVREDSLGTVDLAGSQTFGWFNLPNPRASYGPTFADASQMATECAAAATASGVDLSRFVYLMVYLNDVQAGAEGRAFYNNFNNRPPVVVGRTILSNTGVLTFRGLNSPGLVMHELGHIMGAVHTDSDADPLGFGWFYGTNPKFPNPDGTLSTANATPGWDANNRDLMGFVPANRKVTFAGGTQTIEISRLSQPIGTLPFLVEVPFGTAGAKYVVSARTKVGTDGLVRSACFWRGTACATGVNVAGVRIQRIEPGADPQKAVMSRPGGNRDTTDGVFLAGQEYGDVENSLTIAVDRFDDNGATIRVTAGPVVTTTTTTTTTTIAPVTTLPPAAITASDDYAAAPEVRGPAVIGPQDNTPATLETGEFRACGGMIRTVWTRFVVPTTGNWVAATAGSNFDTVLAAMRPSTVAPAPPVGIGEFIACNDDFGGTPQSQVTFTANAGDVVYLQAGSSGINRNTAGALTVTIRAA